MQGSMLAGLNLNTSTAEVPDNNFSLLPAGKYKASILKYEERSSQTGRVSINFTLVITDGQYEKRKLFDDLTVFNPNSATAVNFGLGRLKQMQLAANLGTGPVTEAALEALVGKAFTVDVIVDRGKKRDDGSFWPDRNKIVEYLPEGHQETSQAPAQQAQPAYSQPIPRAAPQPSPTPQLAPQAGQYTAAPPAPRQAPPQMTQQPVPQMAPQQAYTPAPMPQHMPFNQQ